MSRSRYFACASAVALGVAAGAAAPANAQSAKPAAQPNAIEEVIVTAQRRGENLQQVPATVSVVTASQLAAASVNNTSDLTKIVPGLTMVRSTVGSQPTLRGVGARSVSTGSEGNVALYVDGVYQAQPFANFFELNDIERIEVLKGPQGTLYGRNATGGAISIITKQASFTPTGSASLSYGSDDFRKATAYVSGPIVADKLAGSLSVIGMKQSGYIRNVYLNTELGSRTLSSVRAKLRWRLTDRMEVGATAFNSISSDNANPAWHGLNGNTVANALPNTLNLPLSIRAPTGAYETASYFQPMLKVHSTQFNVNTKVDLDWADFNGVVAYTQNYANASYDSGATVVPTTQIQSLRPFSKGYWAEGILTSKGDNRLSWILGGNYFHDLSEARPSIVAGTTAYYGVRSNAGSGFVEATYKILDNLSITGGVRYTAETKDAWFNQVKPLGASTAGSKTFHSTTPRAVLKYQPTDSLNFYASFSKGFKSGLFAADSAAGATTPRVVNPEKVTAFEVGMKSDLGSRLRLNLAAFHYDYKDLQVLAIITTAGSSVSLLTNAANAEIYGGEANVDWAATDNLTVRGGLSLLHTEFTSFPSATIIVQKPLVNGLGVGNTTVNGVDLKGNELIRAPKVTANLTLDHHMDFYGGRLNSTLALFASGRYWADVNNRVQQKAYHTVDASIAWRAPNNVTYSITGKNLTSAKIATQIYINANGDMVTYDRPAQVFVGVAYDF